MLSEFYKRIGGSASDVLQRFGNEEFILRFIKKFMQDESFNELSAALSEGNVKTAFLAAHTLKGICLNLGFGNLAAASSEVTEFLRSGDLANAEKSFPDLKKCYNELMSEIDNL